MPPCSDILLPPYTQHLTLRTTFYKRPRSRASLLIAVLIVHTEHLVLRLCNFDNFSIRMFKTITVQLEMSTPSLFYMSMNGDCSTFTLSWCLSCHPSAIMKPLSSVIALSAMLPVYDHFSSTEALTTPFL
jgi:hypothetical protein